MTRTSADLKQQSAAAAILQLINSSNGEPGPVFEAILGNAARLCGADFGLLMTYERAWFETAAACGITSEQFEALRGRFRPGPGTAHDQIVRGEAFCQVTDIAADPLARAGNPRRQALFEKAGARSVLVFALRKDGQLLGALSIYRRKVRRFSDRQIGLLESFAAQAVIAMENARLISELRGRTRDLQEVINQQAGTRDVLRAINRPDAELRSVLQVLVETAARLCGADQCNIYAWLRRGAEFPS